jgi:manganese/zinc/iron transport system substrate-binding protein
MICNFRERTIMSPSRRGFGLGLVAALSAPALLRASAPPLAVAATTGMVADAARAVGGAQVAVQALMGPGVDPHGYRQTRTDVLALSRADLILWNGLYLEAQLEELMADFSARKPVVALAEAVPVARRRGHDDYPDRHDPHVWMDPALWTLAAGAARDGLAALRPEAAADFAGGFEAYAAELDALDAYTREILDTVPEQARVLVTAHDAFGYFGSTYGFEVLGVQGISTEAEAGLARIEELVDTLVSRGVPAVFVETSVSERNVRALVEGAAARGHEVAVGGSLYADAMGEAGTYEGTLVGMLDHNATMIARALGGRAPERGMRGRLGGAG